MVLSGERQVEVGGEGTGVANTVEARFRGYQAAQGRK